MSRLKKLLHALVWQQYDSVAFLLAMRNYHNKIWWPAWYLRMGIWGGAIGGELLVAYLTDVDWKPMVAVVLMIPLIVQMFCAFLISILGEAQFWLLYAYTPPLAGIAFLCGLGIHFGFWQWWGLLIGAPFYLGKLISDVSVLWVFLQRETLQHKHERLRPGGVSGYMPALTWQRRARNVRLLSTAILISSIIYLYPVLPNKGINGLGLHATTVRTIQVALSIAMSTVGGLGLDATLLALVSNILPLRFNSQHRWYTTYVGRTALFLPICYLHFIFSPEIPFMMQSAAILILLKQSGLGPVVSRTFRRFSATHQHQLLVTMSLQDGGADAIYYLLPSLTASLKPVAECYAALAIEATKPLDLQRWIHTLSNKLCISEEWLDKKGSPWLTLHRVRDALLTFQNGAELELALQTLQELRSDLYTSDSSLDSASDGAWPTALWIHLKQHQGNLQIG